MISKKLEKDLVIKLRKEGKSYSEILKEVSVAKSTVSLWLRDVGLSKQQNQTLSVKKREAQLRGGQARHLDRVTRTELEVAKAKKCIGKITKRELMLIGVALYWAEGSKQKVHRPSVGLDFANSDPTMVRFYMRWLREILLIEDKDIKLILHIHKTRTSETKVFTNYWLGVTNLKEVNVQKPVIKQHNPTTNRKNIADTYRGLVAIRIRRSTMLNRRVLGWIHGIVSAQ